MRTQQPGVCFLTAGEPGEERPGLPLLVHIAQELGWQIEIARPESLALLGEDVLLSSATDISGPERLRRAQDFDVLWSLGLGPEASFFDRMQLLEVASRHCLVINEPRAMLLWHGKYLPATMALPPPLRIPETLASSDPAWLWREIRKRGGNWVLKPPAGSHGEKIHKCDAADPDVLEVLQDRCALGNYCLGQRFVPEIRDGEIRVLIAAGEIIGRYLRVPASGDFRANLAQGASPRICDLKPEMLPPLLRLGRMLQKQGIHFASVDLCWPWLIEINVANPGGIATLADLEDSKRAGRRALEAIIRAAPRRKP